LGHPSSIGGGELRYSIYIIIEILYLHNN